MNTTKATPADFKRLVKKIRPDTQIEETQYTTNGCSYKVVYAYFFKDNHRTTARLEFMAGDAEAHVFQNNDGYWKSPKWIPEELSELGQALRDMTTILDAFYSVDQSTVGKGR